MAKSNEVIKVLLFVESSVVNGENKNEATVLLMVHLKSRSFAFFL